MRLRNPREGTRASAARITGTHGTIMTHIGKGVGCSRADCPRSAHPARARVRNPRSTTPAAAPTPDRKYSTFLFPPSRRSVRITQRYILVFAPLSGGHAM